MSAAPTGAAALPLGELERVLEQACGVDLSPGVRTLFELVPGHACIRGHVRRGVRSGRNLTRWSKALTSVASFLTEDWTRSDRIAARLLGEA